jgi:hypothetical protein
MASMSSISQFRIDGAGGNPPNSTVPEGGFNVWLSGPYTTGGVPLLPPAAFGLASISQVGVYSNPPQTSRGHGAAIVGGKLVLRTVPNGSTELTAGTALDEEVRLTVT